MAEPTLKDLLAASVRIEKGQANLEKGQANLEKGQANLEKGQANLEKGQADLRREMATKAELARVEAKMATNGDLAKVEAKMATNGDLAKVEAKIDAHRAETAKGFAELDRELTKHAGVHRELEKDVEALKRRPARTAARPARRR